MGEGEKKLMNPLTLSLFPFSPAVHKDAVKSQVASLSMADQS